MEKKSTDAFSWFFKSIYPKYLNLYNLNKDLSLSSQTKCNNIFSDLGVGLYIFTFFSQLRTWFVFYFFFYVVIIHLHWRGEGAGIYCKLIPDSTKSTREKLNRIGTSMNIIYYPIQSGIQEPNSKYRLEKYFNIT